MAERGPASRLVRFVFSVMVFRFVPWLVWFVFIFVFVVVRWFVPWLVRFLFLFVIARVSAPWLVRFFSIELD